MNEQETKNLEFVLTNKVEDYENIYGMFFEVRDGKIHTQVELLDFRVSTEKFDLSALERS